MNLIPSNPVRIFLKEAFLAGAVISLPVFAFVRLIFFELPFSFSEDGVILIKTLLIGWALMIAVKAGCHYLSVLGSKIQESGFQWLFRRNAIMKLAIILVFSVMLYACNAQSSGFHKDLNTGMMTTYKGLKTEDTKMVMNDEVLGHTDIPLGESFMIINERVEGLTVKNNKVAVGCALTITDKDGKVLLSVPDLMKDNGVFDKNSIDYLRCTVNTGKPMKWEEKYLVTVVFTDKYGTGRIENKVTIRMIDIP